MEVSGESESFFTVGSSENKVDTGSFTGLYLSYKYKAAGRYFAGLAGWKRRKRNGSNGWLREPEKNSGA